MVVLGSVCGVVFGRGGAPPYPLHPSETRQQWHALPGAGRADAMYTTQLPGAAVMPRPVLALTHPEPAPWTGPGTPGSLQSLLILLLLWTPDFLIHVCVCLIFMCHNSIKTSVVNHLNQQSVLTRRNKCHCEPSKLTE